MRALLVVALAAGCGRHAPPAPPADRPTLSKGLQGVVDPARGLLGSGIACAADARCQIPPPSECNPEYELVFVDDPRRGPVLVGVVARDDWQHPDSPEADAEMRRRANRIEDALAAAHGGCHR